MANRHSQKMAIGDGTGRVAIRADAHSQQEEEGGEFEGHRPRVFEERTGVLDAAHLGDVLGLEIPERRTTFWSSMDRPAEEHGTRNMDTRNTVTRNSARCMNFMKFHPGGARSSVSTTPAIHCDFKSKIRRNQSKNWRFHSELRFLFTKVGRIGRRPLAKVVKSGDCAAVLDAARGGRLVCAYRISIQLQ